VSRVVCFLEVYQLKFAMNFSRHVYVIRTSYFTFLDLVPLKWLQTCRPIDRGTCLHTVTRIKHITELTLATWNITHIISWVSDKTVVMKTPFISLHLEARHSWYFNWEMFCLKFHFKGKPSVGLYVKTCPNFMSINIRFLVKIVNRRNE
jgi:hypothetical protein